MSRWQKRLKKYERHILLGLLILLLVSFSVVGAVQCQSQGATGPDYGGTFQATPTKTETLSSTEFVGRANRFDRFRYALGAPSLRYAPFFQGESRLRWLPAAWTHVVQEGAARAVGYRCGAEYQLPAAIREAIAARMGGLTFTDALYDKFLRDFYRGAPADFQETVSEVVRKDQFLRPLIDFQRYGIPYEAAYEAWKKRAEQVDLRYVALQGRDFALAARRVENTRTAIQKQQDALLRLVRTTREIDRLGTRIATWRDQNQGAWPKSLADLPGAGTPLPKDGWDRELRYLVADGEGRISSAGPDGAFDTPDDVTDATRRALVAHDAVLQVGNALVAWRKGADRWPDDLPALLAAPGPSALPPLAREVRDGWDRALVYAKPEGDGRPRLLSAGADGQPGTDDDVVGEVQDERTVVRPGPGLAAYVDGALQDAWGRPLEARLADPATSTFETRSAGPDGAFGTADDLLTGNESDLLAFFAEPEVKSDYRLPPRRRFQAIYVHLPLLPDAVLRRMWEAFPQYRPPEGDTFDRWREYHPDPYYGAENPADPAEGHGAALARRLAPEKAATLVPDATIFGEAPLDLVPAESPDRKAYLDGGWRPILLREGFVERMLNDLLRQARESLDLRAAWTEKKKAFDAGKGPDAGPEPAEVTLEKLCWPARSRPTCPAWPTRRTWASSRLRPLTREQWEADANLGGDENLTIAGLSPLSAAAVRGDPDEPPRRHDEGDPPGPRVPARARPGARRGPRPRVREVARAAGARPGARGLREAAGPGPPGGEDEDGARRGGHGGAGRAVRRRGDLARRARRLGQVGRSPLRGRRDRLVHRGPTPGRGDRPLRRRAGRAGVADPRARFLCACAATRASATRAGATRARGPNPARSGAACSWTRAGPGPTRPTSSGSSTAATLPPRCSPPATTRST